MLNQKQKEIIKAIQNPQVRMILIDGDKRTGKTLACFIGIMEEIQNGTKKRWGYWNKSELESIKTLYYIKKDPLFNKFQKIKTTEKRFKIKNKGYIEVGFKNRKIQGVLYENPNRLFRINASAGPESDLKLIIVQNRPFHPKIKNAIQNNENVFITISKRDTTHLNNIQFI